EDWGRRQLAFTLSKVHKAHYVLMNIECDDETLGELEHSFKFNDAVLRHLIIRMERAWTTPSPMTQDEKAKSLLVPGEASRGEAKLGSSVKVNGFLAARSRSSRTLLLHATQIEFAEGE